MLSSEEIQEELAILLSGKGKRRGRPSYKRREEALTPQEMWQRDREVVRHLLAGKGNKQIAEIMGITPQTVYNIKRSAPVQKHLKNLQIKADTTAVERQEVLSRLGTKAAEVVEAELFGDDPSLDPIDRVKQCLQVLKISGFQMPTTVQVDVKQTHMVGAKDRELITQRARKLRRSPIDDVLDAEYEVLEGAIDAG